MSSNNENFVIRNGLEVANSLLYVDDLQNKVGIGTTQLTDLLTVYGGIAATSVSVAQTISAYIGSFTNLNTSGISSLGNVTIGGATDLIVNGTTSFAGIVTVGSGSSAITFNPNTDTITSQNINVVGVLTSPVINVGGGVTIDSSGVYANTFYGDGTGLYGVVNAGGMTIYYNGSPVGYAATIIDFTGTGISTVPFSAGIATVTVDIPSIIGDIIVSGTATITSANIGSLNVSGLTSVVNLYSSGITTLGITSTTGINVSGATTTNSLNIGTSQVISSARQLQNIASLDATTTATIESAIANSPNDFTNLNVSGIATLGTVSVSSGIITATSGVVTYYGDGSKLSGLPQLGIGIQSAGTVIGGGVTTLNFIGSGNTFAINGTTVDISIQSGVSTQWQSINLGIVTTTKVGIGTTNPRYILEVGAVGTSVTTCYVNGDLNTEGLKVFGNSTITGISTLENVRISSGIVTATHYGDGSNLTGITTTIIVSGTSNLTVDSSGGPISATVGGQNVFNVTGAGVSMVSGERFDVSSYSENVQQLGSVSGTVNLGIGTYSVFIADISGITSVSLQYQSGSMVNGRLFSGTLILRFSGTGTRNVSLTSLNPKYIGGTGPTYSTTAVTDILSFFTPDNGATTYVNVVGQGFA